MQPYQQAYRISVIVNSFLVAWNGFHVLGLLSAMGMGGQIRHITLYLLGVWVIATVVGLTFSALSTSYRRKLIITIVVIIFGTLPYFPSIFSSQINSYIRSWEAKHCVKYDHDIELNLNAECDNGDRVFIYPNPNDMRRLFKSKHYPYSLFY
jgi:hypothetical protein